jgi:hypothetical protein
VKSSRFVTVRNAFADPWAYRALGSTTDECALDADGRPRFQIAVFTHQSLLMPEARMTWHKFFDLFAMLALGCLIGLVAGTLLMGA